MDKYQELESAWHSLRFVNPTGCAVESESRSRDSCAEQFQLFNFPTFHFPLSRHCVLCRMRIVGGGAVAVAVCAAAAAAAHASVCAQDCSLNGRCLANGTCACDAGRTGTAFACPSAVPRPPND